MWKTFWGWLTGNRKKNRRLVASSTHFYLDGGVGALKKTVVIVNVPVAYTIGGNPGAFILEGPDANLHIWRPTPKLFVLAADPGVFA